MSRAKVNARSKTRFVCISQREWRLSDKLDGGRRKRLLSGPPLEEIVELMANSATVSSHKRERCRSYPQYYRVVIALKIDSEIVDLFHNSACGYRSQYYRSVKHRQRANDYAVKTLVPRIVQLLTGHAKRTCPLCWVRKSLSNVDAKLWIHQGCWLRCARHGDRILQVKRWLAKQHPCQDPSRRKKARWSSLTPKEESQIDFKGAFLTLDGKPLGRSLKPTRGKDIHECGFT